MLVANVLYRGLAVAMGARICSDDLGPFIELDPPLPVGTALSVELVRGSGVEARPVKVRRVHEGNPAGVFIQFTDGAALPKDLPSKQEAALNVASEPTPVEAKPEPPKADAKPAAEPEPKPAPKPEPKPEPERGTTLKLFGDKGDAPKPAEPKPAHKPEPLPEENYEERRRNRSTMQVSIATQQIIVDTELGESQRRDTLETPALKEPLPDDGDQPGDTQEMPVVTMDAEPEDEELGAQKPTAPKPDDGGKRGGKRNRKRSKTVIGH